MTGNAQESTGTNADKKKEKEKKETKSKDKTKENVKKNDVKKNKKLAEITMMENLREIYSLTIKIPRVPVGLTTGMFIFIPVSEQFYEKNYPEIIKTVANRKFARYAGFEKGRFYIDKIEEQYGFERGASITVNPIPPSFAEYSKMVMEAEKALIQASNQENPESSAETGGSGGGLTEMTGKDTTETFVISTRTYNVNESSKHKIGNSSANYAVDTKEMTAKEALMDIYHRFKYEGYANNRKSPQSMWNKTGTIRGNCADISRLCMCRGQVGGLNIGIHHMSGHYYNLIEWEGKTYRFDCCCQSNGTYRGERTNNLVKKFGGPW